MKKLSKQNISIIAVYAIALAVYLLMFFIIPFPKGTAAWLSFAFTIVSFIGGYGVTWLAFSKAEGAKMDLYGFPMFKIGAAYTGVQFVFGVVLCIVGCFTEISEWIIVLVSVIIIALCAVGVIATSHTRDEIIEAEQQAAKATMKMAEFRLDISTTVDSCTDAELKKQLEKLSEQFRYSDPVSCEELSEIEAKLKDETELLRSLVNTDISAAMEKANSISDLLADRNRRCMAYKKR